MKLSTHYYVLSLSEDTSRLYEAFRESLIDIDNTLFPVRALKVPVESELSVNHRQTLLGVLDDNFGEYFDREPLAMVLAGSARNREAFTALTRHASVIIGNTKSDHSDTSMSDLGHITWDIVKHVMARAGGTIERQLDAAERGHNLRVGIDAVSESVDAGAGATLLVEESYQVLSENEALLLDEEESVVDVVIEKVLALGGNVLFVAEGSLSSVDRIALILEG